MPNIQIKCPRCGAVLTVPSAVGLENKNANCIHCHEPFVVGDAYPKYSLRVNNVNYQLRFGRQWVGRKVDGNDADVQIPDDTRYMSKRHAIIELRCTANGVECTFEEHGKNRTTKDGIRLEADDIIYLSINDCLTLGGRQMYLANDFAQNE